MNLNDTYIQNLVGDYLIKERLGNVNSLCKEATPKESFYTKYLKRILDILFSLTALIITCPINIILGVLTLAFLGKPLFFVQERVGKDGEKFKIVKFRNMTNECDENGNLLPAQERLTKFGKFMRKTSLDELLNFWSILKGDMSFIGPRALPEVYLSRYSNRHRMRLKVKPGLECPLWKKTNKLRTWDDQFENDIWYVENVSFVVDCILVLKLIFLVLNRNDAKMRAECRKGSFIGYSWEGKAISTFDINSEILESAIIGQEKDKECIQEVRRD